LFRVSFFGAGGVGEGQKEKPFACTQKFLHKARVSAKKREKRKKKKREEEKESGGRERERQGGVITTAFYLLSFFLSLSLSLPLFCFCCNLSPKFFGGNCERKRKKHVDASASETVGNDDDWGDGERRSGTGDE
jgi:hypothetical protein